MDVVQRLTLVAEFDDIVRNTAVLTSGIESDFLRFVQNQESCRRRWLESESEAKDARNKLRNLENENATLQTRLRHARSTIDQEIKKRMKVEQEKESLERQIGLVRELLTDKNNQTILNERDRERLAFLSTSCQPSEIIPSPKKPGNLSKIEESLSDRDVDRTEEDLDETSLRSGRRYKKRPSAPPVEDEEDTTPPGKKSKRDSPEKPQRKHRRSRSAVIATTTLTVAESGEVEANSEITGGKSPERRRRSGRMRKHHSAKDIKELTKENIDSDDSYSNNRSNVFTPDRSPLRHTNSYGKGLNRPHYFVSKTVIMREPCIPCGKRIRFGQEAMKCRDCMATAHPGCKDNVPLPCVPSSVPNGNNKNMPGFLSDYVATTDPPMIPALVIHCVREVETRGLSEVGIYRISGADSQIKGLKEKFFRGKGIPNLNQIDDIHVVCGCLKDFFRSLKEPIVTFSLWKDFVNAAEMPDEEDSISATCQAISQLPQANRDTLAYMILHLQRIGNTPECKMPQSSLCKVFGPTLIGHSTPEPQPIQIMSETPRQSRVMERLMSISGDYWDNFLGVSLSPTYNGPNAISTPQTPESIAPAGLHSMLYPDSTEKKNWFTPRFGSKSRQVSKNPTHFFPSPVLK